MRIKVNKIEPLKIHTDKYDAYALDGIGIIKDALVYNKVPNNEELMNKINEIIEYINREE